MTRSGIAAAGWLEKAELAAVWEKCFGDPPRHIHYFFNNLFEPQNCLTYREDGGIVSMVHMLPARIADGGRLVQAHYIYAAATLPEYRSRGLMGQLLEAAFQAGRRRGDRYSFLLPANRSLYRFYGNLGYTVGFELRTLAVSREEMQQAAAGAPVWQFLPDYGKLCDFRREWLSGQDGSAHWDARRLAYADSINRLDGGKLICSMAGDRPAYALCRPAAEAGACEVLELAADPETFAGLAANLVDAIDAQQYFLRLPGDGPLFAGRGRRAGFGMIRSLAAGTAPPVGKSPYLGLTLD